MSSITAKVWFVTGSSSGLGRSVVSHLLEKGDKVVATLRNPNDISELTEKYPKDQLVAVKLDVVSSSEISEAFSKAIETFGRVDIVYNNAGYAILGEIEGTPDETARRLFEVNFWGSTNVTREAVRVFRDVNKPSGGRLIQASSVAGIHAVPGFGYYSASKYAAEGIIQALASELHPSWNIKLIILELGSYHTRAVDPRSLSVAPQHPAYTSPDSITQTMRGMFTPENVPKVGDPNKAAREIRNIGLDTSIAGLRIPLGLDALGAVSTQLSEVQKDLGAAVKWSTGLKFE